MTDFDIAIIGAGMAGASVAGDIVARCTAAWDAGCDMLLVCNTPESVGDLLARWRPVADPLRAARVERLCPATGASDWASLQQDATYQNGVKAVRQLSA